MSTGISSSFKFPESPDSYQFFHKKEYHPPQHPSLKRWDTSSMSNLWRSHLTNSVTLQSRKSWSITFDTFSNIHTNRYSYSKWRLRNTSSSETKVPIGLVNVTWKGSNQITFPETPLLKLKPLTYANGVNSSKYTFECVIMPLTSNIMLFKDFPQLPYFWVHAKFLISRHFQQ